MGCIGFVFTEAKIFCSHKCHYIPTLSSHTIPLFVRKFVNGQNRVTTISPTMMILRLYHTNRTANTLRFSSHRFSFIYFLFTITTNKPICIWKLSENLPFNMWTRTDIGLAFDGAHVYRPESLCIAFWTKSRLVVSLPFSVTKEMPPLGESKFITWKRTKAQTQKKNEIKINIVILLITWINKKLYAGVVWYVVV